MCGILFVDQKKKDISFSNFKKVLSLQNWRGPNNTSFISINQKKILLGHNRLSILDTKSRSNQPMISGDGRYFLIFNGEIYNYKTIIKKYNLKLKTLSDSEVILQGYILKGKKILKDLDGMFSFIIFDKKKNKWFCARDRYGIKPLFIFQDNTKTVIGSEAGSIARLLNLRIDNKSISEWKLMRHPTPNYSFFKKLYQFPKSSYLTNSSLNYTSYYKLKKKNKIISQKKIISLINESVERHQMGDVNSTSLLSGGIDSTIILDNAKKINNCYSVGLERNNEFNAARNIAKKLNKKISLIQVRSRELKNSWRYLTNLRGEPLSVPNEGLIYLVCKKMKKKEKIVLTGEGADEIFFGYDRIFRWALKQKKFNFNKFIQFYSYSKTIKPTKRLKDYILNLKGKKKVINFIEDFFYDFHLPVLLRRMDFASMAASKEARVPFVTKKIIDNLYRINQNIKIDQTFSKKPLRKYLKSSNLNFVLKTKKIGFSANLNESFDKYDEYKLFQNIVLSTFRKIFKK